MKITHSLCFNTEYFCLPWAAALMGHCFVYLILIAVPLPDNILCVGSRGSVTYLHTCLQVWIQIHHKCRHHPGHLWHRDCHAAAPDACSRPYPASLIPAYLLPLLVFCLVLGSWRWHQRMVPMPLVTMKTKDYRHVSFSWKSSKNDVLNFKVS